MLNFRAVMQAANGPKSSACTVEYGVSSEDRQRI
jgi:hypothetical protein